MEARLNAARNCGSRRSTFRRCRKLAVRAIAKTASQNLIEKTTKTYLRLHRVTPRTAVTASCAHRGALSSGLRPWTSACGYFGCSRTLQLLAPQIRTARRAQ
jgi:hypothetical protein